MALWPWVLDHDLYTKNSQFWKFVAVGGIRISQTYLFFFLFIGYLGYFLMLQIADDGAIPETHIWSNIIVINFDFKIVYPS